MRLPGGGPRQANVVRPRAIAGDGIGAPAASTRIREIASRFRATRNGAGLLRTCIANGPPRLRTPANPMFRRRAPRVIGPRSRIVPRSRRGNGSRADRIVPPSRRGNESRADRIVPRNRRGNGSRADRIVPRSRRGNGSRAGRIVPPSRRGNAMGSVRVTAISVAVPRRNGNRHGRRIGLLRPEAVNHGVVRRARLRGALPEQARGRKIGQRVTGLPPGVRPPVDGKKTGRPAAAGTRIDLLRGAPGAMTDRPEIDLTSRRARSVPEVTSAADSGTPGARVVPAGADGQAASDVPGDRAGPRAVKAGSVRVLRVAESPAEAGAAGGGQGR